jgi:iron(III) transport system substrate-binding protein
MWAKLGAPFCQELWSRWKQNQVGILAGNKPVAQAVSRGEFAAGLTDTDDAILEVEAGKPVRLVYLDDESAADDRLGTLYLPNTIARIQGSPNPEGAQKLFDYLRRPESEDQLATSGGYQIPLHPDSRAKLHPELRRPGQVRPMNIDFHSAADAWEACQAWLRDHFTT